MRTTVEPLEGNRVKLSVEVGEDEFERAIDAAARKIAREVRIPGFRPGKAPRRLIEARLGPEVARKEALREALPEYYAQAVRESELDAIAAPEFDIVSGEESGPVAFDAVVEIRPRVQIPGYGGLRVTVPTPYVTDEDVTAQVDRLRDQFAELEPVSRPARDGDHVTIDLKATRHTEEVEALSAPDFLYEVGSGSAVRGLDEQLRGARTGDILKFNANVAREGEPEQEITFQVLVKDVKEKRLPEATDAWVSDASEFDTMAELEDDLRHRIAGMKRARAVLALRDAVVGALVELVDEEPPESLVAEELERRMGDLIRRLQSQGATIEQYMAATGTTRDQLLEGVREGAAHAVKADLALRAVADAEELEPTDEEVDEHVAALAERAGQKPAAFRRQLERVDHMPAVRSDIKKAKALEWLVDHVEIVDEEGQPVERSDLEPPPPPDGSGSTVTPSSGGPGSAGPDPAGPDPANMEETAE